MAISHEQVVDSLIAFYKSRGTDLSHVLEDPVFKKLPIESKVEAIKRNASILAAGTSKGWTSEEKSNVTSDAINGAITGAISAGTAIPVGIALLAAKGIPLANSMANSKALAITLAGGALVGGALGGITSYARTRNEVLARHQIGNQFNKIHENPSNENAIGALSLRGIYSREHSLRSSLVNRIADKLDSNIESFNAERAPRLFANNYAVADPNVKNFELF